MKFTAITLYQTAENFFQYTSKNGLGIKAKSKSFDLWARILAGKNYSPLLSRLKDKDPDIEYELNTQTIIVLFREKKRVIDEKQAITIFANAVAPCLADVSELASTLVDLIKENDSYSVMAAYPARLGLIDDSKPGYMSLNDGFFSDHDRASDFQHLILELAGQSLDRHFEIFATMHRNSDKFANQEFKVFLKQNVDFPSFMSERIFQTIDLDDEYSRVEACVADIIQEYFKSAKVRPGKFLTINTPMVTDFIESLSGTIMSTLGYYRDTDDEELVFSQDSFEFHVRSKIEFYTGE